MAVKLQLFKRGSYIISRPTAEHLCYAFGSLRVLYIVCMHVRVYVCVLMNARCTCIKALISLHYELQADELQAPRYV